MLIGWLRDAVIQSDYLDTSFTTIYIDRAFDIGTAVIFQPK